MFRIGQAAYIAVILLLASAAANAETGIRLDRLSPEHRKIWEAIKQSIVSENADGTPLHPKLRSLFEQLQTSAHTIYLEFDDSNACRYVVGQFLIERLDPVGGNVAVVRLYVRNIEHASTDPLPNSKDGFVPLAGLKKIDRYAEVLGHEMAHVVDILFNQERANLVDNFLKERDRALEQRVDSKTKKIAPEVEWVLRQRDAFLNELEKPALIAEEQIWRELSKANLK